MGQNYIVPRPLTPLRLLLDAGLMDPRLEAFIVGHSGSLDARQAQEPLTEDSLWGTSDWERAFHDAAPIGSSRPCPG
jgi:hypothetical protein